MIASWSSGDGVKLWNFFINTTICCDCSPISATDHLYSFALHLLWFEVVMSSTRVLFRLLYFFVFCRYLRFHFSPLYCKVEGSWEHNDFIYLTNQYRVSSSFVVSSRTESYLKDIIWRTSVSILLNSLASIYSTENSIVWKRSDHRFSRSLCSFSNNEVREVFTFPPEILAPSSRDIRLLLVEFFF